MIGKAYLVGAGPGRPDLITVRGLNLLRQADVILYDRLIAQELLQEARPEADLVFVGKGPDRHIMKQEEITQLLIDLVYAGKQVVRLKGGDPFVFGRGGEEILELAQAGLPFEVVPGVSSALAAPAYAGIPMTHRGLVTSFAVVTGHEDPTKPESSTDWSALAKVPVLVLLMAKKNISKIRDDLLAAGRDPNTPAAAISWATTDRQQVIRTTLKELPETVAVQELPTPMVIVLGEVVNLREQLNWFDPDGQAAGFIPLDDFVFNGYAEKR